MSMSRLNSIIEETIKLLPNNTIKYIMYKVELVPRKWISNEPSLLLNLSDCFNDPFYVINIDSGRDKNREGL